MIKLLEQGNVLVKKSIIHNPQLNLPLNWIGNGLRQIRDVDLGIFQGMDQECEMFQLRLAELKKYES